MSVLGFIAGSAPLPPLLFTTIISAWSLILVNRLADGVDGTLARMKGATDSGAYLDISLDFVFYSAVVFGFALADPIGNSLAAAALIFSFVGTGSSFLAYAILAERRKLTNLRLPNKGFYYLGGIAEGTETTLFFILFCLAPGSFTPLAWLLAAICWISTGLRITYAYKTLKSDGNNLDRRQG